MSVMSWQEAENILTEKFPMPKYTVTMGRSRHYGNIPLSNVFAAVYVDGDADSEYYASAYDEHDEHDEGGWATVANEIRRQVEAKQQESA